jgi:hypothetical protein
MTRPVSVCRRPTRTLSPGFRPCASSGRASRKAIVMPRMPRVGKSLCSISACVGEISSMRASASCSAAGAAAGCDAARAMMPRRLASESIRNWPLVTTFWPSDRPRVTTVSPSTSAPVATSTGRNRPPSSATMTSARRPVRMTASDGTRNAGSLAPPSSVTCADRPGRSLSPGLGSSTRTRSVRAASFSDGSSAVTRPSRVCPGTATSSHTRSMPLICATVWPAISVMPARTPSSCTTPPRGAAMVTRACGRPVDSTSRTIASGMPASRIRSRAAATSPASPATRNDRNSCCTPAHSGTSSSASAAPARITSPGARGATLSTYPVARAWTTVTSRSLKPTRPVASTRVFTGAFFTAATRTPRFWTTAGSIFTTFASAPVSPSA